MPAMNKPSAGDTDWTTEINDNWSALENQLKDAFQGRLQLDATTQVSLRRYNGDVVEVNGKNVSLGAGGIALTKDDNLITSTGADAGAAMAASTLYYVYLANADASPFSADLRASATAPSSYNGVKYLGTSGNAANWRFVGWVRANGSTQFVDSESQRWVVNHYNRRALPLVVTDSTSSWTYTTATYRSWNNSTSNRVEFIANGEDPVVLHFHSNAFNSGAFRFGVGIGLDSTSVNAAGVFPIGGVNNVVTAQAFFSSASTEGYHYLQLLEISEASGTTTFNGRWGGNTWAQSGAWGWVMG